ncbi:MAG: DNA adenine methylase [Candidatus Nanopelagicales bacterium]
MTPPGVRRRGLPLSPLRYPGGKAALSGLLSDWCGGRASDERRRYVESYAGGAAAALHLLESGSVTDVQINDLDPAIYAFWAEVVDEHERFCERILATPVTLDEWHRQREVYRARGEGTVARYDLGFATFFLNRTNRSGVLRGGVIGGQAQTADDKIHARFNKDTLVRRIRAIGSMADRIEVTNLDGADVILGQQDDRSVYLYIDPPYVRKGGSLYYNSLDLDGHQHLASTLRGLPDANWIVTYDDVPEVRVLYADFRIVAYPIDYSASRRGAELELMIFANSVPDQIVAQVAATGSRVR